MMNILAIDIGGSKLMAAPVRIDTNGADIGPVSRRSLQRDCSREELIRILREVIDSFEPAAFKGIGVTIPGLANPETGMWVYAPFSGIRDFPIGSILSEYGGGRPVLIDNDVNACALAEKKFGLCRGIDDYLWITVSNGVGGGLVLGGNPYRGHWGNAAEIGHFKVVDNDPFPCGCGHFGCLEAEAAGPGIEKRYRRLLHEQHPDRSPVTPLSAKEIAQFARDGDPIAIAVVETTGTLLGKAAGYVANLLNLELIVFGGGVMESFDLFYPSMEQSFQAGLFQSANPSIRLERTTLGYNAALLGAAALGADLP